MKVRGHSLSPSVARGIAGLCAATFVARTHTVQAGINVWTSHGPEGGYIRALAIDPAPGVLYAGTYGDGVFKSTDGGGTWNALNTGLTNSNVLALAIDPLTPSTLYAGTLGGAFKSTDAGATWGLSMPNTYVSALTIDRLTPSTLYAGTNGAAFKSTDGGERDLET